MLIFSFNFFNDLFFSIVFYIFFHFSKISQFFKCVLIFLTNFPFKLLIYFSSLHFFVQFPSLFNFNHIKLHHHRVNCWHVATIKFRPIVNAHTAKEQAESDPRASNVNNELHYLHNFMLFSFDNFFRSLLVSFSLGSRLSGSFFNMK
jgi:hypothetical protein